MNELNYVHSEADCLLGGWKYEGINKKCMKTGAKLELVISDCVTINCTWLRAINPVVEIIKLSPKVKSNFIPGYTTKGLPTGTIQLNSRWLDTNPPEYMVMSYFLREIIRCLFWKEAISTSKTRFTKTGAKLQSIFSKYGLTVDTKGNLIEGCANKEGRFIFREILTSMEVECPDHIQVETPAPASRKARKPPIETIEKTYQEKIAALQMELAYLSDENEQLRLQQSHASLPIEDSQEELDEPSTNYDIPIFQGVDALEGTKQENKADGRNKATAGM